MVDESCPHCVYLFDDIMISAHGDLYCKIERELVDQYGSTDYALCNSDNYTTCPRFLRQQKVELKIKGERQEIGNLDDVLFE